MALHAQDCLNWELEKNPFSFYNNNKNVFVSETSLFLWSWPGVVALMLRHNMRKTVLTGSWRMFFFSRVVVLYIHFIPGNTVSLVLVRRYSAHAMASHAQDCPDRKLERPILPWSSRISCFYCRKYRLSSPGQALSRSCHGITRVRLS